MTLTKGQREAITGLASDVSIIGTDLEDLVADWGDQDREAREETVATLISTLGDLATAGQVAAKLAKQIDGGMD